VRFETGAGGVDRDGIEERPRHALRKTAHVETRRTAQRQLAGETVPHANDSRTLLFSRRGTSILPRQHQRSAASSTRGCAGPAATEWLTPHVRLPVAPHKLFGAQKWDGNSLCLSHFLIAIVLITINWRDYGLNDFHLPSLFYFALIPPPAFLADKFKNLSYGPRPNPPAVPACGSRRTPPACPRCSPPPAG